MRKQMIATAFIAVFAAAISANAQTKVDYSGTWTLDTAKSKLAMPVESMKLTVVQSETELVVTTETKRPAPPQGAGEGRGQGRRSMGEGDAAMTYSLDGKEKTVEMSGPMGAMPAALKAKMDGGKLHLSQTRKFTSPMGEISMTTTEIWSIDANGVLTIDRETTTPRGTNSSTLVLTKN
jgi:hypothetical protein